MLTDTSLAIVHHLTMFALAIVLVAEMMAIRGAVDAGFVPRLAGIDRAYGLLALSMLAIGLARVFFGLRGPEFYFANPYFHAKLGAFVLVGLLSVLPTIRTARWNRAAKADPDFRPSEADIRTSRRFMHLQAVVLATIPVLAALMARYTG